MRVTWTILLAFLCLAFAVDPAFAQEADVAANGDGGIWGIALGAGLAIGLAGLGCGIGQGLATSGAVDGIARNPGAAGQIQTPMIIGLALIESIALYAFVIAFILQGKF